MNRSRITRLSVVAGALGYVGLAFAQAITHHTPPVTRGQQSNFDNVIRSFAREELERGQQTFRYDTFGDQAFWGGQLGLHRAIEGAALGGTGPGLSARAALENGLKVDVAALPQSLRDALRTGQVDLDDPAVTVQLLKLNAVVGVTGIFGGNGQLQSVGIQCALCHSTVDNRFASGIGARLDGWANRDLNIGHIVSLAPNLQPIADLLGVDQTTVRAVLNSWGAGKFDAELILDGKATRPDGSSAATLIPPAFGLRGVNLHTWTGWGSITHWNAFVANLEMHGKGVFFDPRLDNADQFPIAARNHFGHVVADSDLITEKLPALHYYQLSIPAPRPPEGSFDAEAAERGDAVFSGQGRCATCHTDELYSEPGWNMHKAEEIGIDDFQANRAPDRAYRTSPLKGLWTHTKGGFFHDGRFATLLDVVDHYDAFFHLGLSDHQKSDLVEYLKSLSDDVPSNVRHRDDLNAGVEAVNAEAVGAGASAVSIWPVPARRGDAVHVAFLAPPGGVPGDLAVSVFDAAGRRLTTVPRAALGVQQRMVTASWDGRDGARPAAPGVYFVRITSPASGLRMDRKIVLR